MSLDNLVGISLDRQTVISLDAMRKQRNVADYSGDIVPPSLVEECVLQAEALQRDVVRWLKEKYPELLG